MWRVDAPVRVAAGAGVGHGGEHDAEHDDKHEAEDAHSDQREVLAPAVLDAHSIVLGLFCLHLYL